MPKQLILNPKADQDLDKEALYLAESYSEDTALRFYAACDAAFQRILTYPEIGKLRQFRNPQITDIRVWSVKDFSNYLVFYRFSEKQIEILRILHGARDLETLFETEFGVE